MSTTFIIIRHGYSKSNEYGRFIGQTDVALSERGKIQAEQTAKYLYGHYSIDFIYSSPLQRAYQTAVPLSNYFHLPIQIETDLQEINGGAWEGKLPEELLKLYRDDYTLWLSNIGVARCTQGENMQEVQNRALKLLSKIANKHEDKTIAIITHAGVIRALQCFWNNLPLSEMKTIPWVENCSLSIIHQTNKIFYPIEIGSCQHFQEP